MLIFEFHKLSFLICLLFNDRFIIESPEFSLFSFFFYFFMFFYECLLLRLLSQIEKLKIVSQWKIINC